MQNKQREKLVNEINTTRQIIAKSTSPKAKVDRIKHLKKLERELRDYDRFSGNARL